MGLTELEAAYKLIGGWRGLLGIVSTLTLSILLVIQKGETRHWKKEAGRYEQLYHNEQTAFAQTVVNYRTAAEKARQDDAANKARVEAKQAAINQERDASYEARIADARARAERLQHSQAAAHPGSSGTTSVPGVPSGPGGPDGPPAEAGLPPSDALIATEQAIQLDELQRWVKSQSSIPVNSPPSPPTGSR
jgi:uncharacterized iron-regulated membrane protein